LKKCATEGQEDKRKQRDSVKLIAMVLEENTGYKVGSNLVQLPNPIVMLIILWVLNGNENSICSKQYQKLYTADRNREEVFDFIECDGGHNELYNLYVWMWSV
jgi:hypothetical protein